MYHWIEDKDFLRRAKSVCSDIVNQLVQAINSEDVMEVRQHLVGSGAKNLVVQNASEPIDFDFNLELLDAGDYRITDCRGIKEYVRKAFNRILNRADWGDCHDSTSALTTDKIHFKKGNQTCFSIDLCIIRVGQDGRWYRLIHDKTGLVALDGYAWNEAQKSRGLTDKVDWLKHNDCWQEVRETYLDKKNMYLSRVDHNHPSFNVYIEAVNEVFFKYNCA